MSRFRIAYNDGVKARAYSESGKLLAVLNDSGYTTIGQVQSAVISKIPYYSGKKLRISIVNEDKETYKDYDIKVNQ
jgi:hypothetical protein